MPFPTISEQKELDARIAELEHELVGLKRRRNGLSAISQVPAEVLCEILLQATTFSEPGLDDPMDMQLREDGCIQSLCHVCHIWRTIAFASPQLWSEIDVCATSKAAHVELFVGRSHPLPLSFCVKEGSTRVGSETDQLTLYDAMKRVLLESGRLFNEVTLIGNPQFLMQYLEICPESTRMRGIHLINASFAVSSLGSTKPALT
ncbi:hypothetical protein NMY22_g7690 [Coprinellus aureogranulatus]|nr:hypothetical protein NMY22_g7690 [Coprinellus aureogranulatus]